MAASRPLIQESPRDTALDMTREMLALARHGDWDRVERVAVMLRSAVLDVPEAERREIAAAADKATEQVRALAEQARGDVASRLKALRRGQNAARAYGVNTGHHRLLSEVRPGA
jgi:hypothetical protein